MVSKADRHRKPHKRRATYTPVSIRLLKQLGDGVEQGKCYWVIPPIGERSIVMSGITLQNELGLQ